MVWAPSSSSVVTERSRRGSLFRDRLVGALTLSSSLALVYFSFGVDSGRPCSADEAATVRDGCCMYEWVFDPVNGVFTSPNRRGAHDLDEVSDPR
jgi:hypothetical protein